MHYIILYIHGMGGGGDSRIPSVLNSLLASSKPEYTGGDTAEVIVRTYDFDPEVAARTISGWVSELKPHLIIGESLGANQALRIKGIPHLFVSPSLGAPLYFGYLSILALVPGVTKLLDKIYKPREGDRQKLCFTFKVMRKYRAHRKAALASSPKNGGKDYFFAFFGTKDHYRKTGVVSIRLWRKYFGPGSYQVYDGTHFMEEDYIVSMLLPKVWEVLRNRR